MATVRASCPSCGDVELTTRELEVQVCSVTRTSSYSFACPTCRAVVTRPAPTAVVDVLVAAGTRLVSWPLPAEMTERHRGAPISHDDLLAFHEALEDDGWMAELGSR